MDTWIAIRWCGLRASLGPGGCSDGSGAHWIGFGAHCCFMDAPRELLPRMNDAEALGALCFSFTEQ